MNREAVDQWCERAILVLTLAILITGPLAFGGRPQIPANSFLDPILVDPFALAQWLTIPVMLSWLTRLWANVRPQLLWPPICWAVLAFVGYAVGRYLTADIEYVARQELIRIIVYAGLFFAVLNNLHRQESTQIIAYALIFLGMVISFYAIYQFITGSNRVWHVFKPYPHRGTGTYISPNHLGGFLEMILPLGFAYTLLGRSKPLIKVLLGYSSLVILIGIGVTLSRGSWISTGIALLMF